jgi:hypothetical protein
MVVVRGECYDVAIANDDGPAGASSGRAGY